MCVVEWDQAFCMLNDLAPTDEDDRRAWALAIHRAIARAAQEMIEYALDFSPHRAVGLSGGVFMNRILTDCLVSRLDQIGIEPLLHCRVPPNDGAIAMGQALAGNAILKQQQRGREE